MSILNIIRIVSVVGLSAVKLITEMIRASEARNSGLIGPAYDNRCLPHYHNQQPMMYQNIQQGPTWQSEYGRSQVYQQPMRQQYPSQPVQEPYAYAEPVCAPPIQQPQPVTVPVAPPVQQMPVQQQPVVPVTQRSSRRWCRFNGYSGYNGYRGQQYVPNAYSQPYPPQMMTYPSRRNNIMVYPNMGYTQPCYQQNMNGPPPIQRGYNSNQSNELQWATKSLGQMERERQQQMLRSKYENNGVVAMFCTDSGEPLYGPPVANY